MAWIVPIPPSPRHPKPRWQVRYQDGSRERSAGIFNSPKAAETVRKRIDRGLPPTLEVLATDSVDATKAQTLIGDYITNTWWPAWKASLVAEGLKPTTVNTYPSLLGTILTTAVDSDYLPHSPLMRKSHAGRVAAAKNLPVDRREVWITRRQLDALAEAIDARYRALVRVAALTGMRWGELAALRWEDMRLDHPLDDGAVSGPGRLRVVRAFSDPGRSGNGRFKGPKTQAGRRTIALDTETCETLRQHHDEFRDEETGLVFTTPGGARQGWDAGRQQLPPRVDAGAQAGRPGRPVAGVRRAALP